MFPQFLGVDMHPVFSLYAKTFLASIEINKADESWPYGRKGAKMHSTACLGWIIRTVVCTLKHNFCAVF